MDSKVASTVNMMQVTLKARALTSKSQQASHWRLVPATDSSLVGTRHLKILVMDPHLNMAKRDTSNRATAKRVVIPMLLTIPTRHRGKKVNVV